MGTAPWMREWLTLNPTEFEQLVVAHLRGLGQPLRQFEIQHRRQLSGPDGEFEIDAVATFEALGVEFIVLVECKHHKNPIKREVVQVLADKVGSVRAHKGVLFSTAAFQSGAVELAASRRLALVHFTEGGPIYETKAAFGPQGPKRPYDSYSVSQSSSGGMTYHSDARGGLSERLFGSSLEPL